MLCYMTFWKYCTYTKQKKKHNELNFCVSFLAQFIFWPKRCELWKLDFRPSIMHSEQSLIHTFGRTSLEHRFFFCNQRSYKRGRTACCFEVFVTLVVTTQQQNGLRWQVHPCIQYCPTSSSAITLIHQLFSTHGLVILLNRAFIAFWLFQRSWPLWWLVRIVFFPWFIVFGKQN